MKRKGLALGLALTLTASTLPMSTLAATPGQFKDMPDNWSKESLEKAVNNGLLQGYDSMIFPQDSLTRAEMATVVNRAFGAEREEDISEFKDVNKEDWFYIEMARAVAMETFEGYGTNLNPNDAITRQEAFAVIARALNIEKSKEAPAGYSDLAKISPWAKEELYGLIKQGYVQGYDGKINPQEEITRAEFAKVMDNIIAKYINKAGEYTADVQDNIMINAEDVVLKDSTIAGDLIIGDGVGEGDVTLDNVKVTGEVIVRGGGTDSLIVKGDSDIRSITTAKVKGAVRIASEGNAKIGNVSVQGKDDVILEGAFKTVNISSNDTKVTARKASIEDVTVEGENSNLSLDKDTSVGKLNLKGEGAKADLSGKVETVTVDEKAKKTTINVDKDGEVNSVEANSEGTKVTGKGKVKEVKANANNVSIDTKDTTVSAGKDTEGVTSGGQTVKPGETVVPTPPSKPNTPNKPSTETDGELEEVATVSAISIKTEPIIVEYTEGDVLDLSGLVVTLTKTDKTTEDVAFSNFEEKKITTVKADGSALVEADKEIMISVNGKTTKQAITVKPKIDQKIVDEEKVKFDGISFADEKAIKAVSVAEGVSIAVEVTEAATTEAPGTATVTLTKGDGKATITNVLLNQKFKTEEDTRVPSIEGFYGIKGKVGSDDFKDSNRIEDDAVGFTTDNNLVIKFDSKDFTDKTLKARIIDITNDSEEAIEEVLDVELIKGEDYAVIDSSKFDPKRIYQIQLTSGEDIEGEKVKLSTVTITTDDPEKPFTELYDATFSTAFIENIEDIESRNMTAALNTSTGENRYSHKQPGVIPTKLGRNHIIFWFNENIFRRDEVEVTYKDTLGNDVPFNIMWEVDNIGFHLQPKEDLEHDTDYIITVGGFKDVVGNTSPTRTIKFTTE